jgi:hypothetical protein
VTTGELIYRVHALQRMFLRRITDEDVRHVLASGTTVESYPDDTPYPSRLVLGWQSRRPIHVVVADNTADQQTIVVTVYEPDPERWYPGFERRKRR